MIYLLYHSNSLSFIGEIYFCCISITPLTTGNPVKEIIIEQQKEMVEDQNILQQSNLENQHSEIR